jgi:hypothetical protein
MPVLNELGFCQQVKVLLDFKLVLFKSAGDIFGSLGRDASAQVLKQSRLKVAVQGNSP